MPARNHLENIQHAQDAYREFEEDLEDLDEEAADTIRRRLEDAEDRFDDTPKDDDALRNARADIQTAQDGINTLQESVADDRLEENLEDFEDHLEVIEDGITDDLLEDGNKEEEDDYEVTVSGETKTLSQEMISPVDLLREFEYDPNRYVLYPPDEDERLPKTEDIDLEEQTEFDAIPVDTAYGHAQLDNVLETHVEELRSDYEVEVDSEAETQFTHVIVRDYSIPSEAYNKQMTDVMIRIHQNYPQKAPDWVYVDEDLQLADGGQLQSSRDGRVRGWLALSWHINSLNGVEWRPYETGLRWYLDTIVSSRLRQGN